MYSYFTTQSLLIFFLRGYTKLNPRNNQYCIQSSKNNTGHEKTKHIDTKSITWSVSEYNQGIHQLPRQTNKNVAHLLTKPFNRDLFWQHLSAATTLIHDIIEI